MADSAPTNLERPVASPTSAVSPSPGSPRPAEASTTLPPSTVAPAAAPAADRVSRAEEQTKPAGNDSRNNEQTMAPRHGQGLDFTPIVTHYLFLVTFVLAIVSGQ